METPQITSPRATSTALTPGGVRENKIEDLKCRKSGVGTVFGLSLHAIEKLGGACLRPEVHEVDLGLCTWAEIGNRQDLGQVQRANKHQGKNRTTAHAWTRHKLQI